MHKHSCVKQYTPKKEEEKNLITLKHFHTHTNILWKPNLSETSIALSGRLTTRTDLFSTLDDQRTHFLIRTPTINLLGTVPLPASRVARGAPHHVSSLKAKVERSGSAWRRAVTLTPDPGYLLWALIGQVLRYGVTSVTWWAYFFFFLHV